MVSAEFKGYVEKIFSAGPYDREFIVSNFNGDAGKQQMLDDFTAKKPGAEKPCSLTFSASVKSGASNQLEDLSEGDLVNVKFFLSGVTGISKKGSYYHINKLMVAKNGGVTVIQKAQKPTESEEIDVNDASDIPF